MDKTMENGFDYFMKFLEYEVSEYLKRNGYENDNGKAIEAVASTLSNNEWLSMHFYEILEEEVVEYFKN